MTRRQRSSFRSLMGMIALLLLLALACNAPTGADEESPEPPTAAPDEASATPAEAPAAPSDTPLPAATAAPAEISTATPQPTFTPIQQPTLAATSTLSPTPEATATDEPTAEPTVASTATSSGPLTLDYSISWRLSPDDPLVSIASVTLVATGGDGNYTFYRDELPTGGPVFEYFWASCRANPGSFRVTSGDGQSVKIDYFEQPPCPTPVP